MATHPGSKGNERDGEAERIRTDLEARLPAQPTLDTDIMEFLAITGINYRGWGPYDALAQGDHAQRKIYDELERKRRERSRLLTPGDRLVQSHVVKAIRNDYATLKTIAEFKTYVERIGPGPGLSLRGVALLNSYFERFGLEPISVPFGRNETLTKYGLTKSKR